MEAVGLDHHPAKGFMLVHRCVRCGHVRRNRVAPDDEIGGNPWEAGGQYPVWM